ncbi:MAG: hypothetical protein JW847_05270 [Candidatus Omnitrophica bacterium]|nr:hypothetical protein [Candidatus Omnitrophota bacterium]
MKHATGSINALMSNIVTGPSISIGFTPILAYCDTINFNFASFGFRLPKFPSLPDYSFIRSPLPFINFSPRTTEAIITIRVVRLIHASIFFVSGRHTYIDRTINMIITAKNKAVIVYIIRVTFHHSIAA